MSELHVWKLTPVAQPEDPRWLGRSPRPETFVAAATSGEALLTAAKWDMSDSDGRVGNESGHLHSAFGDEKLYRIDRATGEEVATVSLPIDGPSVLEEA